MTQTFIYEDAHDVSTFSVEKKRLYLNDKGCHGVNYDYGRCRDCSKHGDQQDKSDAASACSGKSHGTLH